MNRVLRVAGAVGLGAGLMYLFDPDRGKRRRILLRDRTLHAARIAADVAGKKRRGVRNHLLGAFAAVQSLCRSGEVSDPVLEARVRSKLGRVVSHPHPVEVRTSHGVVTLSGPILAPEVHPLLDAVAAVNGVKGIENWLKVHERADDIPGIQAGASPQADVVSL